MAMRLHLGCGNQRIEGFVNCDLYPGPSVDHAFNVCHKWPFQDDSAEAIYASHLLEHLPDPKAFFAEAWRVLRPDGEMMLRVPYGGHKAAWWDLEHLRPWHAETFCFLQPGYAQAVGNHQHDGWTAFFDVRRVRMRVHRRLARMLRSRWRRRLLIHWVAMTADWCEELFVDLKALKTPLAVQGFHMTRQANGVPINYVAYQHHMEGRANPRDGEAATLIPLAESENINGFW